MSNAQQFFARLKKRGFGATATDLPEDLMLVPQTWSVSDRGGMKQCSVMASGGAASLAYLAGWLGDDLEIYNADGDLVWWGVVWDLEISLGNSQLSYSLDNIYNRVAVIYPYVNPDGTVESYTTSWVENADSIARYGVRELLYGLPESFTDSSEMVRDQLLARFKDAAPIISSQRGSFYGATLTGMGLWYKAKSIYFTNPDGLVEHKGEGGAFYIGRYLASNQISFGALTPGGEDDEIHIATGNFDPLDPGDQFTISGAAQGANNDTYTIEGQDAANQISISGTFTPEASGASVKISWGEGISYDNIAMSFIPASSWVCTRVAVKVRQVGNPGDSLRIGIYPDSGGVPGTVLTYNETLGSVLFSELTWTEFAFSTPVALTAGTKYYIGIRRTGAATLASGYEVALDEDLEYAGGSALFYTGTSWVTRNPNADMPFRVIGEISSTAQIVKVVEAVADFNQSLVQVDSQIAIRQYSMDQRTASEELDEMLDAGTSTGERLVAWVTPDGTVVVGTAETVGYGESYTVLDGNGKLKFGNGAFYPPGRLVFGQRIEMENLNLLDGVNVRVDSNSRVYVQESEYDALTETVTVQSEGALDPWRALTIRKG